MTPPDATPSTGFELGADIAAARHLDDFYTFEMNSSGLIARYADILFHHLKSDLPKGYLATRWEILSPGDLIDKLFVDRSVFVELVHASEGNLHDFIQVFAHAFQRSGPRRPRVIDMEAARKAAVDYTYLHELSNLPSDLRHVMQDIVRVLVSEVQHLGWAALRRLCHPRAHPTRQFITRFRCNIRS